MSVKKQNKLKSYRDKMLETRQQSLDFFAGIEFRYEKLGSIHGCAIINDSRSTSLEDTLYSLELTKTPVHLILGNIDVQKLLEYLETEIRLKVVTLGVYGSNDFTKRFEISKLVDKTVYYQKMDDVVINMIQWVKSGETLLFSPGSPDFGSYENFTQTGEQFNKVVAPYLTK